MKVNASVSNIPVKVEYRPAPQYHWKRRVTQLVTLLLIVLSTLSGSPYSPYPPKRILSSYN